MKTIIIDDEKPARDLIKAYLKNHPELELQAECENGFDGIKKIQELNPQIVFLDIQMPKISGLEMLELIENPPVVIFSTAFDEYAVKAFEKNAIDYLLKPYSAARFDEAVQKAKEKVRNRNKLDINAIKNVKHQAEGILDRIAIRNGSSISIIPVEEIHFIEAQDDYVCFYCTGNKKYLKQYTMNYLEDALPSEQYLRVHRSYIINLQSILKLESITKDTFEAKLKENHRVPVSRSGYQRLKQNLQI